MQPYEEKQRAYACDVVYGTNSELGLRLPARQHGQGPLRKGPARARVRDRGRGRQHPDRRGAHAADHLRRARTGRRPVREVRAPGAADERGRDARRAWTRARRSSSWRTSTSRSTRSTRRSSITEQGVAKAERFLGIDHLYRAENGHLVNHLIQALRARVAVQARRGLRGDRRRGEDHRRVHRAHPRRAGAGRRGCTRRSRPRRGCAIQEENQTLATITYQNYFRLYDKLAGMTGTALTEATEFMKIYELPVVQVPTNMPMVRDDRNDQVYKTKEGKWNAVVKEIAARHENGQPVLVGTISVEVSELLSERLKKRGIEHAVLNAKPEHAAREAEIVAEAGQPGAVTIATNMAGPRRGHQARRQPRAPGAPAAGQGGGRARRPKATSERLQALLPEIERACRGQPRARDGRRRAVHLRHRAPRVAAHRQPAARALRAPGRPGRVALLPLRRGRSGAGCSRAIASTGSSTNWAGSTRRATRNRSRRGCSPSRSRKPRRRSRSRTS